MLQQPPDKNDSPNGGASNVVRNKDESDEMKQRIERLALQILKASKLKTSNDSFEELKKQYKSLPRLNKKQFETLPKEQREQYIRMLENITTKLSATILFTTPNSEMGGQKTFDQQNLIMNDFVKGFNQVDKDFSHITLQAMQMAIERRREQERRVLEQKRKEIEGKAPIDSILKKLDFKLKCLKFRNNNQDLEKEKDLLKEKMLNTGKPIETDPATYFKVIPFICDTFSDAQWIKIIVLMYYHNTAWMKLVSDITDPVLRNYKVEEYMIYTVMNGDKNEYQAIKRYEYSTDPDMALKRQQTNDEKRDIEIFNKNIQEKWPHLSNLEKLKCYLREDAKQHHDEIVKKAKLIGLNDEGVLDLFIETFNGGSGSSMFIPSFNPNTFREVVPLRQLDKILALGFHNHSLEIAQTLNVPEKLVTYIHKTFALSKVEDFSKVTNHLLNIASFQTLYHQELESSPTKLSVLDAQSKL